MREPRKMKLKKILLFFFLSIFVCRSFFPGQTQKIIIGGKKPNFSYKVEFPLKGIKEVLIEISVIEEFAEVRLTEKRIRKSEKV